MNNHFRFDEMISKYQFTKSYLSITAPFINKIADQNKKS